MLPRAKLIPYLGLVFSAYAVYSFMDEPIFKFLFIFLLILPLVSGLLLLFTRRALQWEIVPLRSEGRRLDEVIFLLKIENRLPLVLPRIRFLLAAKIHPRAFVMRQTDLLEIGALGSLEPIDVLARAMRQSPPESLTLEQYRERSGILRQIPTRRALGQNLDLPETAFLNLQLAGREEAIYQLTFLPGHCGIERLEAVHVRMDDMFSFFTTKAPINTQQSRDYTILPNPVFFRARVSEDLPDPQPIDVERWTDRIGNEVNALANIRAWRPGDRMKDIHWKVSAKAQEFLVKEYEDPRKGSILFLLDPYWPDAIETAGRPDFKDEFCEVTSALFTAMQRKEGPFTLRHLDQRMETPGEGHSARPVDRYLAGLRFRSLHEEDQVRGSGEAYFEQLTDMKTQRSPIGPPSLAKMLTDEYKLESWRAIVIITANVGRPLAESILRILRERTAQIVLVSAEPADYLTARFALERGSTQRPSERLLRRAELALAEAEELQHLSLRDLFDSANEHQTHPLALHEESLRRFRASGGLVFRAPFHSLSRGEGTEDEMRGGNRG